MGPVEGLSCPWGRGGFLPEIGFPRAAASTANLLSVLFPSLLLSGRAQSLLNSNVSLPFLSVLTGRGGYSLGGWLEPDPGSAGQRLLPPGSERAEVAALRPPGELAEEQRLLQELHLALDWALRRPPVLVEHWAGRRVIIQYGGCTGHLCPNPARSQREKGDRHVFTCWSARLNQNTTWSKTVSPLKSVQPWWA